MEKEEYDPTGKKDYLQMCQSLKIVPVSHFTRCLVAQDSVVDLRHHCVGARGAKAIAAALTVRKEGLCMCTGLLRFLLPPSLIHQTMHFFVILA